MSRTYPALIPSATTILLKPKATNSGFEVLLLQRNSKIKTHGGSWVFPGGKCDPVDYDNIEDAERFAELAIETQLQVAKRAAIRETCEEASITADASSLMLVSNWITPESLKKRFNTFFFIAEHHSEAVTVDQSEICDYYWIDPEEALQEQAKGQLPLPPPTYLTLLLLAKHQNPQHAIRAMTQNPTTYRPKLIITNTGFHSLYEEDSGYKQARLEMKKPSHRLIVDSGKFDYIKQL